METTRTLSVDEAAARRLLLVRAIEEADPEGRIVGAAERDAAEQEALAEVRDASRQVDPGRYLQARTARLLAITAKRQPAIAARQVPAEWSHWLAWALPLAACLIGAALDRIDNPRHVNMLSPPLLGVLAWNVLAYLLLAAGAIGLFRPRWVRLPSAWPRGPWSRRGAGPLRAAVEGRFHALWLAATGRRQAWRLQELLHWTAAGWAMGLALSIVVGGLVRQYQVGWESTLLDAGAVHGVLSVLFWPVVALLPFDGFSTADVQRMAFDAQPPAGVLEARRWVWMYLALLGIVVAVPRALLAIWAGWRARHAGPVEIDLADAYFADIVARALPARVTVAIQGEDADAAEVLRRLFLQLSPGAARHVAGNVIETGQGDVLRLLDDGENVERADVLLVARPGSPSVEVVRADEPTRPVARIRLAALRGLADDVVLVQAVEQALPVARRPAFGRIAQAWRRRRQEARDHATRLLAGWLLDAARDSEVVPVNAGGLRRLLDPTLREQTRRDREAAAQALLERLRTSERETASELQRVFGTGFTGSATEVPGHAVQARWEHPMDSPQAGFAGAASGAAMGAGVDVALGGMTLGAAAALGALIGGAIGLTAAVRKNRSLPESQSLVQWGDDVLQTLTEHAVLAYLAAARRDPAARAEAAWPAWRSEVVAAVEHRREALATLWAQARAADAAPDRGALAGELAAIALAVDARLQA